LGLRHILEWYSFESRIPPSLPRVSREQLIVLDEEVGEWRFKDNAISLPFGVIAEYGSNQLLGVCDRNDMAQLTQMVDKVMKFGWDTAFGCAEQIQAAFSSRPFLHSKLR
jgi:hypothetical protein